MSAVSWLLTSSEFSAKCVTIFHVFTLTVLRFSSLPRPESEVRNYSSDATIGGGGYFRTFLSWASSSNRVENRNVCSSALVAGRTHSLIPLGTASTRIQGHREYFGHLAHLSANVVHEIITSPPRHRSITLLGQRTDLTLRIVNKRR